VAKYKPATPDVIERAIAAVEAAWDDGCPVVSHEATKRQKVASLALRRIRSFERRGIASADEIKDLASGLIVQLEENPRLVGPLRADYEYLAAKILTAIGHC
jgi:hypothetical protein